MSELDDLEGRLRREWVRDDEIIGIPVRSDDIELTMAVPKPLDVFDRLTRAGFLIVRRTDRGDAA
jgi:hypothetical protein